MAGASRYEDDEDGAITDINVTPFVDVALVLLVIFIVTAKLIVTRGVDVSPPRASAGAGVASALRLVVDAGGELYVGGARATDDDDAIARIRALAARAGADGAPRAIVSGDRATAYAGVMRAIDLATRAGVTSIALENVAP